MDNDVTSDILIHIQKRLNKVESDCATQLLIIKDLQNELNYKPIRSKRRKPVIIDLSEPGTPIQSNIPT
ncbi:MAG: hypothetical protein NWP41_01170, partial [Ilumatobacteraceae bacterium]|nr:hypothetical protein [Ilumatobacteraceae bacterium]